MEVRACRTVRKTASFVSKNNGWRYQRTAKRLIYILQNEFRLISTLSIICFLHQNMWGRGREKSQGVVGGLKLMTNRWGLFMIS